jgi:hypothetical protein
MQQIQTGGAHDRRQIRAASGTTGEVSGRRVEEHLSLEELGIDPDAVSRYPEGVGLVDQEPERGT